MKKNKQFIKVVLIGMTFLFCSFAFSGIVANITAENTPNLETPAVTGDITGNILDYGGVPTDWLVTQADVPTGTSYLLFEHFGGFWADAEKDPNPGDDLLCWAATGANMLEYTGWGFVTGMEHDNTDDFFDFYIDHVTDLGHYVEDGLDWWFDGTLKDVNASVEDVDHTGFWLGYTPSTYIWSSWSKPDTLSNIDNQLRNERAVGISIYGVGGSGAHAVTCWGFNYNASVNPATDEEDYYLGVWLTDSDNSKNVFNPDDILRYYAVEYDSTNNWWWMPSYGSGWYIWGVASLELFPGEQRPVASLANTVGNEGSAITFDASSSSDPDGDPLEYRWDFDADGTWDTAWSSSSTATHTWDDDYTGTVYLEVFDGRLRDIDTATVTVNNIAPTISISGDTVDENGVATVSGTITDPSPLDSFTIVIDWGEGTPQSYTYAAGTTMFSESHQYFDDNPSGTSSDIYAISVSITDDDGGVDSDSTTVTVNNVAPIISVSGDIIDENGIATVSGTITDPGALDSFTIVIDWGEGTPQTYSYAAGTITFSETHQYLDDNPTGTPSDVYTISVSITDDDGGADSESTTVTVNNVDPIVTEISMDQPNPQFILPIIHTLDFTGSFTDIGTLDTHTAIWDWGDSTTTVGVVIESSGSGIVTGSHVYSAPGNYTVTLTVTDDDSEIAIDTFLVEVVDAHGALDDLNDYIQSLSDDAFKNDPENSKNAMSNKIDALHNKLDAGDYKGAINDLFKHLREKADGSIDGKPNNDWITNSEAQDHICMKIDDIIAYLETFL